MTNSKRQTEVSFKKVEGLARCKITINLEFHCDFECPDSLSEATVAEKVENLLKSPFKIATDYPTVVHYKDGTVLSCLETGYSKYEMHEVEIDTYTRLQR